MYSEFRGIEKNVLATLYNKEKDLINYMEAAKGSFIGVYQVLDVLLKSDAQTSELNLKEAIKDTSHKRKKRLIAIMLQEERFKTY